MDPVARERRRALLLAVPALTLFAAFWLLPMAKLVQVGAGGPEGIAAYWAVVTNARYFGSLVSTVALSLGADGDLRLAPIGELASLRRRQLVDLRDVGVDDAAKALAALRGDGLEIELELAPSPQAAKRGLSVRVAPGRAEATDLYVDGAARRLEIDRTRTSEGKSYGVQGGAFDPGSENLRMRVFLDRSVLEVYANDRACFSRVIYPGERDLGLALFAREGSMTVRSLNLWPMQTIFK